MKTLICIVMLTALSIGAPASAQTAKAEHFSPSELNCRMVERRAVQAVIWGLPLVGEDAVKQAAFRNGKANFNDIVSWPKGGG